MSNGIRGGEQRARTCQPSSPAGPPRAAEDSARRALALAPPPEAGKTTVTGRRLRLGGAITLAAQVKAKRARRATRSDWMAIERERGISVVTSVMTFDYDGRVFNLMAEGNPIAGIL